jgi:hypothetical protein
MHPFTQIVLNYPDLILPIFNQYIECDIIQNICMFPSICKNIYVYTHNNVWFEHLNNTFKIIYERERERKSYSIHESKLIISPNLKRCDFSTGAILTKMSMQRYFFEVCSIDTIIFKNLLLDDNIDIRFQHDHSFRIACEEGILNNVKLLLEKYPDIDIYGYNDHVMLKVIEYGHQSVFNFLMDIARKKNID